MIRRSNVCPFLTAALLAVASLPARAQEGLTPAWQKALSGGTAAQLEEAFAAELEARPADAAGAWALAQARAARGERARAAVTALEGLERDPGSPLAFLLEGLLTQEASFDRSTTQLIGESLPRLLRSDALDPWVRFDLRWLDYRMAARRGDPAARLEAMRRAGFPDRGLFAVTSGTLARLDYLQRHPAEQGRLSSLAWSPSQWDLPTVRPPLYQIPDDRESVVFALLPFRLDRDSEALLYVNGVTSFRVYLDGKEILAKDFFRRQEDPSAMRRLSLGAGSHTLLVKSFASGGNEGIHLALLDGRGDGLPVVWSDSTGEALAKVAASKDLGASLPRFEAGFPAADPRRMAFQGLYERWLGDSAQGRLLLERAAREQPRCLFWNLLTAQAYLFEADDLPQKVAQSRSEAAVDAVTSVDATCAVARFLAALMKQASSDSDDDLPILQELQSQSPGDPRWGLKLASRYQQKGWVAQARDVLRRVRLDHPESEEVETAWAGFASTVADREAQKDAIERLGRLRNNAPERELYFESTLQLDALSSLLEEEIRTFGDRDLQFARQLARLDARRGDYPSAERRFRLLVAQAPEDEGPAFDLARLLALTGRADEARAIWDRLKQSKPRLFQIDMARWLMGEPLPFEEKRLALGTVLAEDRSEGPEEAPSSLLLDQQFTRVESDGSSLERYHGIIRVNDKEGVDREGEQSLRGQVVLAVRTVKPDGRSLEPEQIAEKESLSMPGLEAGDLIEMEYITFLPPNEVRDRSYLTAQVFLFQDLEKPFHRTQWYLEYPSAMGMHFYEQNLPKPSEEGQAAGRRFRNWDFRAMPRIAPEPDTPYKTQFIPLAEAAGGVEWKDLGLFLKNRMTGAFLVTPELEAQSEEILRGATTPAQRVAAIVRFVQNEVDGGQGQPWQDPTQTLLTRRGNRIPLACALLERAGVPYRLLFAEPVVNRVERQDLPRIGQYTVPVLEVSPAGAPRAFYTLDSQYRATDALPWFLQGARALPVTAAEPWKAMLLPVDRARWNAASEVEKRTLTAEGDLTVSHRQTLDPDASESLRETFHRVPKDQWKRVQQVYLSRQYGNADVSDFSFGDFEEVERPLRWDYALKVTGYASVAGGRLTVPEPIPPLHLSREMASLTERKLPLATGATLTLRQRMEIVLPEGAVTDYAPQALDLTTPFGEYHLTGTLTGGMLAFDRRLEIPYQVIPPERYPAFREFLRRIDAAESGQLVLSLPGASR